LKQKVKPVDSDLLVETTTLLTAIPKPTSPTATPDSPDADDTITTSLASVFGRAAFSVRFDKP
jgi:hypothetical protein